MGYGTQLKTVDGWKTSFGPEQPSEKVPQSYHKSGLLWIRMLIWNKHRVNCFQKNEHVGSVGMVMEDIVLCDGSTPGHMPLTLSRNVDNGPQS